MTHNLSVRNRERNGRWYAAISAPSVASGYLLVPARKHVYHNFELSAVQNSYSARMRGCTYYRFAALPNGEGYTGWRRIDELPGAIIKSRAFNGTNSAARHSRTDVEVELPEGTLIKTVAKGQHRTTIERVKDGELTEDGVEFVGNVKTPNGWATVIKVDGRRVTI